MKNILVPCDFSPVATEAFKFALDLAHQDRGQITVLFAIDLPVFVGGFDLQPYLYDPSLANDLKVWATARFNELLKLNSLRIPVNLQTTQATVLQAVRQAVKSNRSDLVVMGTQGAHGANEVLFGSNTEKIVRFSPVPVFSIRQSIPLSAINKIVFPTDMATIHPSLISELKKLQDFFDASLDILWINTPVNFRTDKEIEKNLAKLAADHSLKNYSVCISNSLDAEGGIIGYTRKVQADVIAMATHGRRGLAHIFDGSLTEDVVNHANLPVWTYSLHGKE
ncbi:MAG TPA: universal stress protein [Cyclobacteriaceae bacterium]|nr:universal stress protein [Cyclobacteriaceae bacterium]